MLKEDINIAISTYCSNDPYNKGSDLVIRDYCGDLNEMHKVELCLWYDDLLIEQYEENLRKEYLYAVGYEGCSCWFMAEPGIRAAAFLKTVGLWKD